MILRRQSAHAWRGALVIAGFSAIAAMATSPTHTPNPKMALWRSSVLLKGANVAVVASQLTRPDFPALKNAGANLVVLSADGIMTQTPPYGADTSAVRRLDEAVNAARLAGLLIVIAARTGPGLADISIEAQTPGLQSRLWLDTGARSAFSRMWQLMATRYSENPLVIGYDVIVEPLPEAAVLRTSCCVDSSRIALERARIDWPAIADTIVQAIRQVDSLTPVIIGATGFSLPPFFSLLRPIHDPYVVYDVHQYEPHAYTFQGVTAGTTIGLAWPGGVFRYWRDGKTDTLNHAWLRDVLRPVQQFQQRAGNAPILVGEFGVTPHAPGAAGFIRTETALFDSLGWHSAMWLWGCCGVMALGAADSAGSPEKSQLLSTYQTYWRHR